jgi:hypothetical protein
MALVGELDGERESDLAKGDDGDLHVCISPDWG